MTRIFWFKDELTRIFWFKDKLKRIFLLEVKLPRMRCQGYFLVKMISRDTEFISYRLSIKLVLHD